jgi:pimeloyl-ACP methyl ester carboxylesterase
LEPVSHYFYSHRLKLHFWDWGQEEKPSLILVHGGLDHARNWDWVARALRDDYHVYAMDLRGHGNSAWAEGALYSVAEHILDLSALIDIIDDYPIYLLGHSLGGVVVLHYAGIYPDRVRKVVAIEGLGPPPNSRFFRPADEKMRAWIETIRNTERRDPRTYPNLEAAVARMKEANKHLSDEVERGRIADMEIRQLCPRVRSLRPERRRLETDSQLRPLPCAFVLGYGKLGARP